MDIGFTPKHRSHLNPFVSWAALLCTALLASLPLMLLAAETTPPPPPTGAQTQPHEPPQPGTSGEIGSCTQKCIVSTGASDCMKSAGDDTTARSKCYDAVKSCLAQLCPNATPPTQPTMPPHQEMTPPSPTSDANSCVQKCLVSTGASDCLKNAGDDKTARNKCYDAVKSCLAQQCASQVPAPFTHNEQTQSASGQPQGAPGKMPPTDGMMGGQSGLNKDQLAQVQAHLKTFAAQLEKVKARIAALQKKGISLPEELSSAVSAVDSAISQVSAAQSMDDIQSIQGDLQDAAQTIRQWMPQLERLANLPSIYARIDRQLKSLDRQLAQDQALAKRSKVDISSTVDAFASALSQLKDTYAAAKATIASGDLENGFDSLQNEVFGAMSDVTSFHTVIQQTVRLSSALSHASREISLDQAKLNHLSKAGKDIAVAQGILDSMKTSLSDLKTEATASPIDPDAVSGTLQELQDLRQQFNDAMQAFQSTNAASPLDQGLTSTPDLNTNL